MRRKLFLACACLAPIRFWAFWVSFFALETEGIIGALLGMSLEFFESSSARNLAFKRSPSFAHDAYHDG